jgi:uncharacterized protein
MPRSSMSHEDSQRVLAQQNLVGVAFRDGGSVYLIPLGYVWLGSALYGVTEAGRKTEIAAQNPTVAFQVDTSARTGLWEWESVTGEGQFAIVGGAEKQAAISALQSVIAQAPDWWRREQAPRMASGQLLVWRIRPSQVDGCRYSPGPEGHG